jgi:endonuclease/exonuclease/phosphatase family metal-dependent hydrolase
MLPLVSLDHCYYDEPLHVQSSRLWRSKMALWASDHLPLIVDFYVSNVSRMPRHTREHSAA